MNAIDPYLLGNAALYARLSLVTEVLGKFVSAAPCAVDVAQLEKQTGRSPRELQKVCAMLCREGLLQVQPKQTHQWVLACEASLVTLEDVFRCVMAEKRARDRARNAPGETDAPRREVDLLLMQATMGIQQSVFRHLRQFSLDRLKVGAAGMLGAHRANVWPRLSFS
ncbi:MAG TPA: Rrf2 family transcriptional regulator [Noviherbaspirillum sp.]